MKMKYSLVPSRAVGDKRLTFGAFRTLAALCLYTSQRGICYPNQKTLAEVRGVTRPVITKHMGQLRRLGYVTDLVPIGKKHKNAFKRGNRMFVPTTEADQPPPLEELKYDILAESRKPDVY